MGNFVDRHPKLVGVLAVCATYLGSMFIHRKHVEKVNDQRFRWAQEFGTHVKASDALASAGADLYEKEDDS